MMQFSNISIRKLDKTDLHRLQKIGSTTFMDTYAWGNSIESMQRYIEENFSFDALQKQIENAASTFFFAQLNDELAGYLKLNIDQAQTEKMSPEYLEIERIYVLKKYQGKKIGKALMQKAIEEAESNNKAFLWLGVWKKNPEAITFYEKQGFEKFGEHIFHFSGEDQVDLIMRKLVG